jgi:SAM-dependent methyltransferase
VTARIGREPLYDKFADAFLEHAKDGFYNALYDRPACLELLGDLAGKQVLDAACGPGLYAAELSSRGAQVTGFDISPRMVELSRQRVPEGNFRVHDLVDALDWLPSGSFDLVLCALALEHVDDRLTALAELRRVLRPGGALVVSLQHPTGGWLRHGGSYFDVRVIREQWNKGWEVAYWLMPLEVICDEIFRAGFYIERLVEPRPVSHAAEVDPDDYAELSREPRGFIAFRLVPRPAET